MHRYIFSFISFLCLLPSAYAQPAKELADYKSKYPGQSAIRLNEKVEFHFEIAGDSLNIYEDIYEETFFLDEMSSYWKEEELGFSTFNSISNINASTLVPDKKKYKKLPITDFKEKDELSSDIFHDDSRYITFSYTGLQKGAKSKLAFRRSYKDVHLIGREFLQSYIPLEHKTYTLIVDDAIDIGFTEFNFQDLDIKFSEKHEGGKKIYSWEVEMLAPLENESASPEVSWYSAHVIPYVKSYVIKGDTTVVFRNTADLFAWYNSLIDDLNTSTDDPEIQALVDSITANAVDEVDVVRKIFYWVQDNIKYIAIEYGMDGFIPRDVNSVCQNRYGDCKDMASTITALLAYAGVESYITWIGTTKVPYRYEEIPTPVVDNHMIATYIDPDGNYYFLDATGRYYSFGIPSSFIQGKEALIRKGKDEFEVVVVPSLDAEDNMISEKVNLVIEGDKVKGKSKTQISGYQKANLEYQIENLSHEEKLSFYKAYFSKGNNKFLPDNFTERNAYPIENPLELDYDFTIYNYVIRNGDERYINMNLDNTMAGQNIEKDRNIPLKNKYGIAIKNENILEIPKGWSVDYVPEDFKIDDEFIQYNSRYELIDNKLILHQQTNIPYLHMAKEYFERWNKHVDQIKKNQNEIVIIKQNHD